MEVNADRLDECDEVEDGDVELVELLFDAFSGFSVGVSLPPFLWSMTSSGTNT
jgi:hypothetical protein